MRFGLALLASGLTALGATPWTLDQTIEYALQQSPESHIARQRVIAAKSMLRQANAAFWPQLQLGSSYIWTDQPMQVFGSILNQHEFASDLDFNDVPAVDNLNVKGVVTLPLYAGGRNAAARSAALATRNAAEEDADSVRLELSFEIARAFFTLGKLHEFNRAVEAGLSALSNNLQIAHHRFDAGSILKTELLDLEVKLGQAREDLLRSTNAILIARHALKNLAGIDAPDVTFAGSAPLPERPNPNQSINRPDLRAAKYRVRAAAAEVSRARSGRRPTVDAFGSLDWDHGWKLDGSGESWTTGIIMRWPVFDGQRARSKVDEAQARFLIAQEEERQLRLAIDLELETARLRANEAEQRLNVTETVVEQASESTRLTRTRFEQGLALASQVIDAESALISARVRHAEAEADRAIAYAAQLKAAGLSQLSTRNHANTQIQNP